MGSTRQGVSSGRFPHEIVREQWRFRDGILQASNFNFIYTTISQASEEGTHLEYIEKDSSPIREPLTQ